MTDGLSDVSFGRSLCCGWCFVTIGICLFKASPPALEKGFWNIALTLLCCH